MWRLEVNCGCFSFHPSPYFLKQDLSLNRALSEPRGVYVGQAVQPENPLGFLSSAGVTGAHCHIHLFLSVLRIQTVKQEIHPPSHLLVP